jgi:predicted kinase
VARFRGRIDTVQITERPTPVVYVVAGPAGSGKSTMGRALASVTSAVVIDQDTATNPLMAAVAAAAGVGDDLDHPALRGSVRQARYQCIIDIARDNLAIGRDVVLIAPFTTESSNSGAWSEVVRQLRPAHVTLVWVTVPPDVALARRVQRNLPRDRSAQRGAAPTQAGQPVIDFLPASGAADPDAEARSVVARARRRNSGQDPRLV